MGLLKKEEKLLKRLFQKRKNELQGFITHNLKTLDSKEANGHLIETLTLTMKRHTEEVNELTRLEAKIFREIYKYEQADNSRQAVR